MRTRAMVLSMFFGLAGALAGTALGLNMETVPVGGILVIDQAYHIVGHYDGCDTYVYDEFGNYQVVPHADSYDVLASDAVERTISYQGYRLVYPDGSKDLYADVLSIAHAGPLGISAESHAYFAGPHADAQANAMIRFQPRGGLLSIHFSIDAPDCSGAGWRSCAISVKDETTDTVLLSQDYPRGSLIDPYGGNPVVVDATYSVDPAHVYAMRAFVETDSETDRASLAMTYEITPEPNAIVLLALGGLAVMRRRAT